MPPQYLVPAAIHQRVHRAQLLEDRRRVDDGHEVVQARNVVERNVSGLVAKGECLRDGQRLRDARRLDEHVVEALLRREGRERREQVLAQRAADAAIRELDHLLLLLHQATATAHELRIDVDRRHVVHNHCDAHTLAIAEHVVEQRRLACTEEAREHRHRQRTLATSLAHDACRLPHDRVRGERGVTPEEDDGSGICGRLEILRLDIERAHADRKSVV